MDPSIKKTVLGLQAQGVPKHVIADKIQRSVKDNAHHLIDGINYEDKRTRSPATKEAKKRIIQRNQAVKNLKHKKR